MILCLTYHKVAGDAVKSDEDFYTVTVGNVAQQIGKMLTAGFTPLDFRELQTQCAVEGKKFLLTFDDGTADHHRVVLPLLKELGRQAIFFVPTAKLNRVGYLTEAQLREITAAGHVIGCHSHEHKRLDTLADAEIRAQLETSRDLLARFTGNAPWIFAPPGGFINQRVRAVAQSLGLKVIRTMRWGFNQTPDFAALETVPVNRHVTDRRFQKILEGKQPRFLYHGKEAAKALVPARAYEGLRRLVFKMAKKN